MKYVIRILTAFYILASPEMAFTQDNMEKQHTFGDGVAEYSLQNYSKAAQIWQKLADAGSPDAAFRLAQLYDMGFGVEYDPAMAVYYLDISANQGHVGALFMLGNIYLMGKGVEVDADKAYEAFKTAAHKGHVRSMYQLASIYYTGHEDIRDNFQAAFWFAKAKAGLVNQDKQNLANAIYQQIFDQLSSSQQIELLKKLAE